MSKKKKSDSELQGITRLITDATLEVTDLVEAMHKRIVHPPFLPSTPIQHLITNIAGIAYKNIRWSTKFIGGGADKALGKFASVLGEIKDTPEKETLRAALNGVIGDYLEKTENPLQLTMEVRHNGSPIHIAKKSLQKTVPNSSGKILLMIHGSCMSALQWTRKEHNHGASLAEAYNLTPLYLNYNSGRHISTNGQELNELLERLVSQWPSPVEELQIMAHSMGGLVARSAIYYGQQQEKSWTKYLNKAIFLGTPHHGASLEKAGNYLEAVLEAVPYAKPFARLGKIRSAGVTDLRYGSLLDEDWQDIDPYKIRGDHRQNVPLPKGVACFSVAAVLGKKTTSGTTKLFGDNMVGLKSALGEHKISEKKLKFKKKNTFIAYEVNHLDLLSNLEVYAKIKEWVAAPETK